MHQLGVEDRGAGRSSNRVVTERDELVVEKRAGTQPSDADGHAVAAIDVERRVVTQAERDVRLTPREFEILELLAENAGKPVSAQQILKRVWGPEQAVSADTVRVHVGSLRRKLEPDPANPRFLVTEPWVGYRFIAEPID